MKVAWSYVALGNLIEANKYISSENPEAARKVINDIYDTGNKIKEFSEKG
jgi:plasmid stabilization system protein ParE